MVDILCIYIVSVVAMSVSLWTKGDHTTIFCWITSLETETKYILPRLIGSERKNCYRYHAHFTILLTLRGSITPKSDKFYTTYSRRGTEQARHGHLGYMMD